MGVHNRKNAGQYPVYALPHGTTESCLAPLPTTKADAPWPSKSPACVAVLLDANRPRTPLPPFRTQHALPVLSGSPLTPTPYVGTKPPACNHCTSRAHEPTPYYNPVLPYGTAGHVVDLSQYMPEGAPKFILLGKPSGPPGPLWGWAIPPHLLVHVECRPPLLVPLREQVGGYLWVVPAADVVAEEGLVDGLAAVEANL